MSEIQFDVNVANRIAIDVAKDVLSVWWMEIYPFLVNQSESLLQAEIKLYCYTPGVSVGVGVHMENVRANVWVLESQSFCIFVT